MLHVCVSYITHVIILLKYSQHCDVTMLFLVCIRVYCVVISIITIQNC